MRNYIAYYRVSPTPEGFASSELSLEEQQRRVRQYVADHGGKIYEEIVEHASGFDDNRDGLAEAVNGVQIRRDFVLVIANLSRLSRRVHGIATVLANKDVPLEVCDMPDAPKVVLQILGAVVEQEIIWYRESTAAA